MILGGKLQEMGVALYTFLYNCPKFGGGGGGGEASPPDETLPGVHAGSLCLYHRLIILTLKLY